jgi:hypothetical protein
MINETLLEGAMDNLKFEASLATIENLECSIDEGYLQLTLDIDFSKVDLGEFCIGQYQAVLNFPNGELLYNDMDIAILDKTESTTNVFASFLAEESNMPDLITIRHRIFEIKSSCQVQAQVGSKNKIVSTIPDNTGDAETAHLVSIFSHNEGSSCDLVVTAETDEPYNTAWVLCVNKDKNNRSGEVFLAHGVTLQTNSWEFGDTIALDFSTLRAGPWMEASLRIL